MGVTVSNTAIKSMQTETENVLNETANACSIDMKTNVTFNAGDDCTVNGVKEILKQNSQISTKCMQNVINNNTFQQNLTARLKEKAQTISQSLGMPSVNVNNNLLQQAEDLAVSVTNTVQNNCLIKDDTQVTFNCTGKANVSDVVIEVDKGGDFGTNCYQKVSNANEIKQGMVTSLKNASTVKEANTLGGVIVIIAFIIIAAIYFSLEELEGPIGWLIVFIILGMVVTSVIYSWMAPKRGYYPYNKY